MAMKCMVQIPEPIAPVPSASQPGRQVRVTSSDLVVQRSPSAPPRQAIRYAATGVTRP
ncbi:hypothetical protein GA0115250_127224 [Streptomyces sp. BvitLS-983]|nr:hypothetical protein GA0115250_127224 [Streptomyces sp. BvitLS-983]